MKANPLYALLLLGAVLSGHEANAAGAQFSADMVQTAGGRTHTVRYYMGNQKMRTEMKDEGGATVATIIDLKARTMLQLMTADKMYMELPMGGDVATWAADEKTQNEYYAMKRVGSETVNGYACDKYELIPKKQGLEKSTTWIAKKLGYPIKTVGKSYAMELKNIKEGAQPDALFTVPKGYTKMTMPSFGGAGMGQYPAGDDDEKADAPAKEDMSDSIRKGLRGMFGN